MKTKISHPLLESIIIREESIHKGPESAAPAKAGYLQRAREWGNLGGKGHKLHVLLLAQLKNGRFWIAVHSSPFPPHFVMSQLKTPFFLIC